VGSAVRPLADLLLSHHLVDDEQLAGVYAEFGQDGRSFARVLVDRGVIAEPHLVALLAEQAGLAFVELSEVTVDPSAVTLVPAPLCRQYTVLPVRIEAGRLVLATSDPANVFATDDVRSASGLELQLVVATRTDLQAAINRHLRTDNELTDLGVLGGPEDDELARLTEVVDDAPIVKYVNLLISQAVQDRASDIHIEPGEHEMRVRYRIDGVLHEVLRSPRSIQSGVISRLKVMAELDIATRRIPQDGRLSVTVDGAKIDLRLATLPTVWGEKVVMRILDNNAVRLSLAELGFESRNLARFTAGFTRPHGMVLVTGPTGSGKSTTLYATLNRIVRDEINVITVEDPVEYRVMGINQVQVHAKAGLTFAAALRSILRSDPDVVLIGEVRDAETAQIAIEASLTGHLVLSTLHTNDAPSAVTRLGEMGVEPFLVGSALECVLAQRLARRLCSRCREAYQPTGEDLLLAGYPWQPGEPLPTFNRAVGCTACARTGYKGRLALHEVMTVSEQIERLAVERAPASRMAEVAVAQGMHRLREDGMFKVRDGLTTLDEVQRVAG
jgi:type IV pilus assembly protein PilB